MKNKKFRIVSEKLLDNLITFIGDIQLSAAEENDYVLVDYCNTVIDELVHCDRAIVKGKIPPKDNPEKFMKDEGYYNPYEFGKFSPEEMKYLYDSFKRISEQLEGKSKEKKSNKSKKQKTEFDVMEFKQFKPSLNDIAPHMTLSEIKDYLINEPDLTDEERFDLYYEEHRRIQKEKEYKNSESLDKMLKGLGIAPAKNDKKNKNKR